MDMDDNDGHGRQYYIACFRIPPDENFLGIEPIGSRQTYRLAAAPDNAHHFEKALMTDIFTLVS